MSRVELAKIPALTFYKGEYTEAKRTDAIPQLACVGKPCKLYQPEVVRCVNIGGSGTDVDWKCEADLPSSLRFGKVEVGCEGWSRPGDPYVLKGSCSLEYRLVQVPGALRDTDAPLFRPQRNDAAIIFWCCFIFVLFLIGKSFFDSWTRNGTNRRPPHTQPSPGYNPTSGSGWFPGDHRDTPTDAPPPYSKSTPQPPTQGSGWSDFRPGFWTGAAAGGLANHLWNRNRTRNTAPQAYDWETRAAPPRRSSYLRSSPSFNSGRPQPYEDRGEGSSNLGSMRQSTGLGGSRVR